MSKKMRQIQKQNHPHALHVSDEALIIPKSSEPVNANPQSKINTVFAIDGLQSLAANLGTSADKLTTVSHTSDVYYNYAELSAVYSGWLGRRIVDLPVTESLKKGWEIFCPSWEPEKIQKLKAYTDMHLKLQAKIASALKFKRVFGGSLIVAMVDARWGSFKNPIPDFLPKNALLGFQTFDAWQAYAAEMNFMNSLAQNYLYPVNYTIGQIGMASTPLPDAQGKMTQTASAVVHYSRVQRFDGLEIPWYDRQRNRYWGQSLLGSAYSAIRNAGLVDTSIAGLLFRASVPVFKVKDLINIVSDPIQRQAFLERVNLMNYTMSNNDMAIIDALEELSSFEPGNIGSLDAILERFYITCSSASNIPVVKLVGESAKGLNATGQGDLNNYYDMLEDFQNSEVKPALMEMYRKWIVPSFFDELIPEDFEIRFPAIERVTAKEKQESDSAFIDMLIKTKDAGFIDDKIARQELLEKKIFNNLTKEEVERIETEKQENEISLTQALDAADGEYNKRNPTEGILI